MKHTSKILTGAAIAAVVVGGSVTLAVAQGGDKDGNETDRPITGADLDRASEAALAHLGEGRVTETEVGDEESYYEVEVTLDNGSQVDVQLDEQFTVVGDEADGTGETDD